MRVSSVALAAALVGAILLVVTLFVVSLPAEAAEGAETAETAETAEFAAVAGAVQARPAAALRTFKQANPCPATGAVRGQCPGYVVRHVEPVCAGGAATAGNLQWLSLAQAKAQGRWDRQYCQFQRARLAIGSGEQES